MARIFIIDHSLKKPGGHHFDYTSLVAQAAIQAGFETVVGTHRRFRQHQLLPCCQIRNTFTQTTYSSLTHFQNVNRHTAQLLECPSTETTTDPLVYLQPIKSESTWKKYWQRAQVQRQARSFARNLQRFFRDDCFQTTDQVFIPTVSEIDLAGLALFLELQPAARQLEWHLQFHFNLFIGRTPKYAIQEWLIANVREQLRDALQRLNGYPVHLYATSSTLVDQFRALGIDRVRELAYPIDPELNQRQRLGEHRKTLNVTCAGGIRKEKGHQSLEQLIRGTWTQYVKPERARFLVQRKQRKKMRKQQLVFSESAELEEDVTLDSVIQWVNHPLPKQGYVDLIRSTDIGVLLYDSRTYFSRRAGVLGEYLAAGKPVIVPSGCWLSDQLAEPNFKYVQELLDDLTRKQAIDSQVIHWNQNAAAKLEQVVVGNRLIQPNCLVPTAGLASGVVLEFELLEPRSHGYYLSMHMVERDQFGNVLQEQHQITGRRPKGHNLHFFRLHANTHDLEIRLRTAYEDSLLLLSGVTVHQLLDRCVTAQHRPLGSVGLAAADASQAPRLLGDLIENFEHYRRTADAFSGDWFQQHDPAETIRQLLAQRKSLRQAA